jgi:hypothetical protein
VTGAVVAAEDLTEGLGLDQALRLHGLEDIAPALSASALSRDLISVSVGVPGVDVFWASKSAVAIRLFPGDNESYALGEDVAGVAGGPDGVDGGSAEATVVPTSTRAARPVTIHRVIGRSV